METEKLFEKLMGLAGSGKGRRLLNNLKKKDNGLTSHEFDTVLKLYCDTGLPVEVELLKTRRGILSEKQYDILAKEVRINCSVDKFDEFSASLSKLLSCGIKMNPAKMERDDGS
jgi:hypothetical protein